MIWVKVRKLVPGIDLKLEGRENRDTGDGFSMALTAITSDCTT